RLTAAHARAEFPCTRFSPEAVLRWSLRAPAGARASQLRVPIYPAWGSGFLQLFGFLKHFFDGPLHPERLLGNIVVLAFGDFAETSDGVRQFHVLAGESGKLFGDVERLREEPLDLARSRHGQLVLIGQLVDAQDRDDILQVLITLQDSLD